MPVTEPEGEDRPPILGSWNRLYAVVLCTLLLCIVLFRLFSWTFS
jgi:hypothetical protein